MTLANAITLSRIALLPVVFLFWWLDFRALSVVTLGLAMATDYFDGVVARRLNQVSDFGALLDPIADKVLILVVAPFLSSLSLLASWYVSLVVLRNLAQLAAVPVLVWWLKIPFHVKPKQMPKIATALCFVILWLAFSQLDEMLLVVPLLVSAALELWILATYLPRFYQIATRRHDTFE